MDEPFERPRPARDRDEEARHILALYERDPARILARIEDQLAILSARTQTLLSLAAVTITVTGFSGTSIARSGLPAACLLVSGLVCVLVGAAVGIRGILKVRWTTSFAPCSLESTLVGALELRDQKTRAFGAALRLLVVGLSLYVASIAILLIKTAR
jgi:hypothetical protein